MCLFLPVKQTVIHTSSTTSGHHADSKCDFCSHQSKPSSAKSRPKSSKPAALQASSRRRPKSPGSESSDSWDNASVASLERTQVTLIVVYRAGFSIDMLHLSTVSS